MADMELSARLVDQSDLPIRDRWSAVDTITAARATGRWSAALGYAGGTIASAPAPRRWMERDGTGWNALLLWADIPPARREGSTHVQATFRRRLLATLGAVVALVAATLTVASPASAASPDFWEQYASYSSGFGKCIDVAGQTSGVAIQSYTCNGTVNQQVSLDTKNSEGYEYLRFA